VKGIAAKLLALAVVVAVIGLVLAMPQPSGIQAQTPPTVTPTPPPNVTTNATVSGGAGTAPVIECKWELPDMLSQNPTDGFQYTKPGVAGGHVHDDDMAVVPDGDAVKTGTQVPCDLKRDANGNPTGKPEMQDNVRHMIQVKPNALDKPEERRIQVWAAVDHPNGLSNISGVFWKIYHPDGAFKLQVHGERVPVNRCDSYGSGTSADGTMFEAAVHTGQLTKDAVDGAGGQQGIIALCQQNVKALYFTEWRISKEQPCGQYKVELHALSNATESVLTNYIDVICFYDLNLDFTSVDYGPITPGRDKTVPGDTVFASPPGNSLFSVLNGGNLPMGIGLRFKDMLQTNNGTPVPGPKAITKFDACFGTSAATIQCIDPIYSTDPSGNPVTTFTYFHETRSASEATALCTDEVGKLDLSIHPPDFLPAGLYIGSLDITARGVHVGQPNSPNAPLTSCPSPRTDGDGNPILNTDQEDHALPG
jgi:hypothetical protein